MIFQYANKAYGSNLKQVDTGIWCVYSGDFNHDESINLLDASILENEINTFHFGYYNSDINGDGNVDSSDADILIDVENFFLSLDVRTGFVTGAI
mgnify:CR=1 FL=1